MADREVERPSRGDDDRRQSERRGDRHRSDRHRRHRSRSRSRSRSRDKERSSRRHRSRSRSRSRREDRDSKRSRRDDDRASRSRSRTRAEAAQNAAVLAAEAEEAAKKEREAEIEQEQQRLNEEMAKRRERVEMWRREKAAKEAAEAASSSSAAVSEAVPEASAAGSSGEADEEAREGKWSLEDDNEDETEEQAAQDDDGAMEVEDFVLRPLGKPAADDDEDAMDIAESAAPAPAAPAAEEEDDDIDPLEAYMSGVQQEVKKLVAEDLARINASSKGAAATSAITNVEDEEFAVQEEENKPLETEEDILSLAMKRAKKKDLGLVDHDTINYEPFRRNFYIEAEEVKSMTDEEVAVYRGELEGIKIRGQNCPKPIKTWAQCGLNTKVLDVIKKNKFKAPTPIQAQALPAIMSGRDIIGVARTGSGKTLAYLLPLFRHIMDQRPVEQGEGPIALVMTPTRELGVQIFSEVRRFAKHLNVRCACVYGGASLSEQIADMKRGAEIVVCTPGRMINLLSSNAGRITNLQRVTFLVLDEADRMFDMGFEPQVMRIIQNTRPDRQTVLFSATFPRAMEALARRVLQTPLEIQVGGRSIVSSDVTQHVELLPEDHKFLRLLQLLGEKNDPDKRILIFMDRQDSADMLFKQLLEKGYLTLVIHGGKDQGDRDQTLADFKNGVGTVMVATSVLARGLDVKQLHVVVNYDCPNHYEDYVHRCGRTGRAGNKGDAYTFITPEQGKFAGDLIKALELSEQAVPPELVELANDFREQVQQGAAKHHGSGFGGKGLERIEWGRASVIQNQMKEFVDEETGERSGQADAAARAEELAAKIIRGIQRDKEGSPAPTAAAADNAALPGTPPVEPASGSSAPSAPSAAPSAADLAKAAVLAKLNAINQEALREAATRGKGPLPAGLARTASPALAAGAAVPQGVVVQAPAGSTTAPFFAELEINDFPQAARWKVTSKESISQLTEDTGASLTTRGTFVPQGGKLKDGQRKLFLVIEGSSEQIVQHALEEVKRLLTEGTVQAIERGQIQTSQAPGGKYQVLSLEYKR